MQWTPASTRRREVDAQKNVKPPAAPTPAAGAASPAPIAPPAAGAAAAAAGAAAFLPLPLLLLKPLERLGRSCSHLGHDISQRKTKGQQLKGKIVSALFHTFWHCSTHFQGFFRVFQNFSSRSFSQS